MLVPVAPKVPLGNSTILIISNSDRIISLVFIYILFPFVNIDEGKIIPATPLSFNNCFARSTKKVSIELLVK